MKNNFSTAAAFLMALGFAASALAQYSWVDKDGRKVYSDRPPPSEITDKNVLLRPAVAARPTAVPASGTGATNTSTRAAKPDQAQEMAAKVKEADDAEAARKQAESDRIARVKADNCLRAQQAQATYTSGVPLTRINAKGERELLDDATRAVETQRLGAIVASDCH